MHNYRSPSAAVLLSLAFAANPALSSESDVMRPAGPEAASATEHAQVAVGQPKPSSRLEKLPASAYAHGSGAILTQTNSVRTSCFPGRLNAVLRDISGHFGRPVVVTSGYRSGGRQGSYHRKCQAADIQIAGVSPSAIARYARGLSAVGGVGAYGHTRSVHVDVGDRVFSWYGNRRRNASLGGHGCCPACAAMAAAANGKPRFEAVCTG